MPGMPIFDVDAAIKRLRPVMWLKRPRTPADFAGALPEFAVLPRYEGSGGPERLLRDLEAVIEDLPTDDKLKDQDWTWARLILGLDQPEESITERRRDLSEGNGSAKKQRDRSVIHSVLYNLQLRALDAPPASSVYDYGFELLSVSVTLVTRIRHPLNVHHRVELHLRVNRGGQRIIPFCYRGATPFTSVAVLDTLEPHLSMQYIGTSTIAINANRRFPTHFFWLADPPIPGSRLILGLDFEEAYTHHWTVLHSRIRLIPGDAPALQFQAGPRRSLRLARGYRITRESTEPIQEFQARARAKSKNLPYLPPYRVDAKAGDEAFELHCFASDRCIDNQRRIIRK